MGLCRTFELYGTQSLMVTILHSGLLVLCYQLWGMWRNMWQSGWPCQWPNTWRWVLCHRTTPNQRALLPSPSRGMLMLDSIFIISWNYDAGVSLGFDIRVLVHCIGRPLRWLGMPWRAGVKVGCEMTIQPRWSWKAGLRRDTDLVCTSGLPL